MYKKGLLSVPKRRNDDEGLIIRKVCKSSGRARWSYFSKLGLEFFKSEREGRFSQDFCSKLGEGTVKKL